MSFIKIFIILISLTLTLKAYSQNPKKLLKQAHAEYEKFSYQNAIHDYESALKNSQDLTDKERHLLFIRLAWSYRQVHNYQDAERIYRQLLTNSPTLENNEIKNYLYFAQTLASNGKHTEAKTYFAKYNNLQDITNRNEETTKLYENFGALSRNSSSYRVEYLGINSGFADFSPTFYKKGLVFVSSRNNGNAIKRISEWDNSPFLDLYYVDNLAALKGSLNSSSSIASGSKPTTLVPTTKKLGEDFYSPPTANDSKTITGVLDSYEENPKVISKKFSQTLNSSYHEGPAAFFHNSSKIIFTRNNYFQGEEKKSKDGITKLKLFTANLANNEWKNIQEFPYNNNEYSTGHPSLSLDDKTLYFVSDMPNGFGGTDIYRCHWVNNQWSKPVNMGNQINTDGNEKFPFVDTDGNLYFASDGKPSLGGLDMFFIKLTENGIANGKSHNLGAPLNSNFDDFGIITDAERKEGFFTSNRKRGGADDDIYWFTRTGNLYGCRDVIVNVIDNETKLAFKKTKLEYVSKKNPTQKATALTDEFGKIKLCLEADNDFIFSVNNPNYFDNNYYFSNYDASDYEPSKFEIALKRKPTETPIITTKKPIEIVKQKQQLSNTIESSKSTQFRGIVTTGNENTPLDSALVRFINKCNNSVQEMFTQSDGSYVFKRDLTCNYTIEVFKENYGKSTELIEKVSEKRKIFTKKVGKSIPSLFDTKLYKVGDVIKLDNIYYDQENYQFRNDAVKDLQNLTNTLAKYPDMIIEILSHTDSRGNAQENMVLSQKRADYVAEYLVKKGIAKERMKAIGKGETTPVNTCGDGVQCTEAEYQRNRRTEFKILRIEKI